MARKYVYKITYPNGKIYVGVDLIGIGVATSLAPFSEVGVADRTKLDSRAHGRQGDDVDRLSERASPAFPTPLIFPVQSRNLD